MPGGGRPPEDAARKRAVDAVRAERAERKKQRAPAQRARKHGRSALDTMNLLVWVMMGIAIWHFAIFVPDRFWGGIVGAFGSAVVGRGRGRAWRSPAARSTTPAWRPPWRRSPARSSGSGASLVLGAAPTKTPPCCTTGSAPLAPFRPTGLPSIGR